MDFAPSPTLQPILDKVSRFIAEEAIPLERHFHGSFKALLPQLDELRSGSRSSGCGRRSCRASTAAWACRCSSTGWSPRCSAARRSATTCSTARRPTPATWRSCTSYGTREQKERWLEPLARGEIRSCFSMTEPEHAGLEPDAGWRPRARRDGDDYVIDGHKWFTSSADGAAFAIVMAVTDPEAPSRTRARA